MATSLTKVSNVARSSSTFAAASNEAPRALLRSRPQKSSSQVRSAVARKASNDCVPKLPNTVCWVAATPLAESCG
ncbi:MAG: hypothetical protein IPP98_03235 [Gemmatimonadetes bacterium]|nr:hypothetical protein [Gemmatimonadota bacterium]